MTSVTIPLPEEFIGPLAKWVEYAFSPIDHKWSALTEKEKECFGDEATFNRFVAWVQARVAKP